MAQLLEGVAFVINDYYDMLQYKTNAGKLKAVQGGLKWITLTKNRPYRDIYFKIRSKTKRMNPYTFFGCLFTVPPGGTHRCKSVVGDTTAITHVFIDAHVRYNEWNSEFNMKRV